MITFGSPVDTARRAAARDPRGGRGARRRLPRRPGARADRPCPAWTTRAGLPAARPRQVAAPAARVPAPAPRPRGAAAARAPAPVPAWPRAGSRGRARRSPSSCASSSPTTGCSQGGFVIEDRLVTLADIDCPILSFVGEVDEIAPPASVRADRPRRAPRGHLRGARCPPATSASSWAARPSRNDLAGGRRLGCGWRERAGPAARGDRARGRPTWTSPTPRRRAEASATALELPAGVGVEPPRARRGVGAGAHRPHGRAQLAEEATAQLPRLARLAPGAADDADVARRSCSTSRPSAHPTTCASCSRTAPSQRRGQAARRRRGARAALGRRPQGRARRRPDGHPRPSALAVIAALNRLGAVAVMLRPDGDAAREIELGEVEPGGRRPRARRAGAELPGAPGPPARRRRRRRATSAPT